MRARSHALSLAALAAGLALGACGDGLYDAAGVPALGGGGICDSDQILCGGICTTPSASQCGAACEDCALTVTAPPNGVVACLGEGAAGTCGYACTDALGASEGFLKCAAGCCATVALAAGERSTCALLEGGEVACWGANEAGQAGDGAPAPARPAPRLVPLGAGATAVAAGTSHACAVLSGGAVRCWGANEAGQATGTASASPALAPAATPVASGAVAVAAGASHTCALLGGGAVRCWGANAAGQLGPGPGTPIASDATAIAAGHDHACAVVGGAVRCWGANASWQLGATPSGGIATPIGSEVVILAASARQTCAGKASNNADLDDALRCWGDSFGSSVPDDPQGWFLASPQPTPMIPRRDATRATVQNDVTLLAAGAHHVCVRKETTSLECLGRNDRGQLGGLLAEAGRTVAVVMPGVGPAAVALAAGASHTCAAAGDGRLRCWGANDAGQLGDGTTVDPGLGSLATPLGR